MNTKERDELHGRLMRESGEARRNLAALAIRVNEVSRLFSSAGAALASMPSEGDDLGTTRRAIEALPDKEGVYQLIREYNELAALLRSLEQQINSLHI